jgi:hypothetical protein
MRPRKFYCAVNAEPLTCRSSTARICAGSRSNSARRGARSYCSGAPSNIVANEQYDGDGAIIYKHACKLDCEGIVSKRLGSLYRSGRTSHWIKVKNPKAPAVTREVEEDWS